MNPKKSKTEKEKSSVIPRGIRDLSNQVHGSRITKKNFKGQEQIPQVGSVVKWENRGVEYIVKADDFEKMKYRSPRMYIGQKKNLYLLVKYVLEGKGQTGGGEVSTVFTLGEYLKDKGYSEEEIQDSGRIYELERDVIESGAYTSYRRLYLSQTGGEDEEVIGSFYSLQKRGKAKPKQTEKGEEYEIYGKGTKFHISFNAPYSNYLKELKQKKTQFYKIPSKLIGDRFVDQHPTIFNLLDYLIFIRGGDSYPKKVENLLTEMGVNKRYLEEEPKKCFEYLRDGLSYAVEKYPELLSEITFYDSTKTNRTILNAKLILQLGQFDYQKFKDTILIELDEKDLRKCFIAFSAKQQTLEISKSKMQLQTPKNIQSNVLLSKMMKWVSSKINFEKMNKYTYKGTEGFLLAAIDKLGEGQVQSCFGDELRKVKPNPFALIKILKERMKGFERTGEGMTDIGKLMKRLEDRNSGNFK